MSNKIELSIIVLNYNTRDLTLDCLSSLKKVNNETDFEIILCDNGSTDGSVEAITKKYPEVIIVKNNINLGFAKGNNTARKVARGKYVLFLNSDTIVNKGVLPKTIQYIKTHPDTGAVTCKLVLADGSLDKDSRRSFPTPWVAFTHLVLHLDKLFPKSKLFARYWYGYISPDAVQEVDVIQGAYFLTSKKLLDEVDWFSEDYFLDGEDIDLCWKIKKKGYKVIYYPDVYILHLKGVTKGKNKQTQKSTVSLKEKIKFRMSGVDSMEIFYRKRMWKQYPLFLNCLVILSIKYVKLVRIIKLIF
ncbi:MAG: glycosyltransferase family 2 protein [bacterium]|nr:glycosyltransferase family 2 protein [bacterium]